MNPSLRTAPAEPAFRKSGIAILESHHEADFSMEWREDPFPKILFVVGGEGVLHRRRKEFAIRAPALIVVPEGMPHRLSDAKGDPMSLYGICFQNSVYPSRPLIDSVCGKWRLEIGTELPVGTSELLRAILIEERNATPESEDLVLSYISQLLVAIARAEASTMSEEALGSQSRVAAYADRQVSSFWKTEDLDSVARSLGLSRRRFTQLFREATGESWLARLTRLRMEHASHLLEKTRLSVRSVCFECGYSEISSFYRSFKSNFGQSPGEYRKGQAGERGPRLYR